MKIKFFILIVFSNIRFLSYSDTIISVLPVQLKKNLIEYNINFINIHDRQGFKIIQPYLQFAYTRFINNKYFARIEFIDYAYHNELYNKTQSGRKRGDVEFTYFNLFRLNIGFKFKYKKFIFLNSISSNYRWGLGEHYFWEARSIWGEPLFNLNKMNSFGIGFGSGIFCPIYKNFQLGIEYNFHYNFEKYKYTKSEISKEESDAFNFKPNREYSTLQLKLGYKF